jgi:uncharacterized protein
MIDRLLRRVIIFFVHVYRIALSPLLGPSCRYLPTCSQYTLDAYRHHSGLYATGLVMHRLCRCHPWGGYGLDPVPLPEERVLT